MIRPRRRWISPVVIGATAAIVVAALVLNVVNHGPNAGLTAPLQNDIVFTFWGAAYAAAGALITLRKPSNRVGWLVLGAGAIFAWSSFAFEYANLALGPRHLAGGTAALWMLEAVSTVALAMIPLALLVFPDGHLPGRHWRPLAWLCGLGVGCLLAGYGLDPGRLDPASRAINPIAVGGDPNLFRALQLVGWLSVILTFAGAGYATVVRLRRADPATRQQVKWVAYAAVLLGAVWGQNTVATLWPVRNSLLVDLETAAATLAMAAVPAAMGIAIVRYHLFDIDVIIRRTLIYAGLTASLAGVYLCGVFGLGWLFQSFSGQSGALAVTLSTLAVAAVFQPLRHQIQRAVDHHFYRTRYDAAQTLEAFSGRLRQEIDLDALRSEVLGVVRDTVQPSQATLWLRPAEERRP